jgi:hypothetical protein
MRINGIVIWLDGRRVWHGTPLVLVVKSVVYLVAQEVIVFLIAALLPN